MSDFDYVFALNEILRNWQTQKETPSSWACPAWAAWAVWVGWAAPASYPVAVRKEMSLLSDPCGKLCHLFSFILGFDCLAAFLADRHRHPNCGIDQYDLFPWQPAYFGQPYKHPYAQPDSSQQEKVYHPSSSDSQQTLEGNPPDESISNEASDDSVTTSLIDDGGPGNGESENPGDVDWDRVREVGQLLLPLINH